MRFKYYFAFAASRKIFFQTALAIAISFSSKFQEQNEISIEWKRRKNRKQTELVLHCNWILSSREFTIFLPTTRPKLTNSANFVFCGKIAQPEGKIERIKKVSTHSFLSTWTFLIEFYTSGSWKVTYISTEAQLMCEHKTFRKEI